MVNNSKQQKVGAQIGARAQSTLEAQATGVRAALVQWGLSFFDQEHRTALPLRTTAEDNASQRAMMSTTCPPLGVDGGQNGSREYA